jgi:membrane protein implicated in regulation of membrane protease activity
MRHRAGSIPVSIASAAIIAVIGLIVVAANAKQGLSITFAVVFVVFVGAAWAYVRHHRRQRRALQQHLEQDEPIGRR